MEETILLKWLKAEKLFDHFTRLIEPDRRILERLEVDLRWVLGSVGGGSGRVQMLLAAKQMKDAALSSSSSGSCLLSQGGEGA